MASEQPLSQGRSHRGGAVRVGDTVRRPRRAGSELTESLLLHLEAVGFDYSPRFLGIDDRGRQVVEFIEGTADAVPSWMHDDVANARRLGHLAAVVRDVHDALADFDPGPLTPRRPLPVPGGTWNHGDAGYANTVYAEDGSVAALIDWEFCAKASPLNDVAGLVALEIRGPKPGVDDLDRRGAAAIHAFRHVVSGYRMTADLAEELPAACVAVLEDAASFWESFRGDADQIANARWRAEWFRSSAARLLAG